MIRQTQLVLLTTKRAARTLKDLAKARATTQQALLREALIDLAKKYQRIIEP
jgi:hypothetical protein